MSVDCRWAGICAGCAQITLPYNQQLQDKLERMRGAWTEAGLDPAQIESVEIRSIAQAGLRDRADMTLFRQDGSQVMGLYDLDHEKIVDIQTCPQMSESLGRWFSLYREHLMPDLRLGSVRFRVSPSGDRGLWLDFPNIEIKRFLDEATTLQRYMDHAYVELGQKRKTVVEEDGRLKLRDGDLKPWFETYLGDEGKAVPLYCSVGSFTQPGFRANRELVGMVDAHVRSLPARSWLELGAGIGNFTLPLAARFDAVTAIENDPRALAGLSRAAEEAGLSDRIRVSQTNMHRASHRFLELLSEHDAVLADPPRSGLRGFLDSLRELEFEKRPHWFLYVSCFDQSFAQDAAVLQECGYAPRHVEGLDQFPQSKHCEWVALFEKQTTG